MMKLAKYSIETDKTVLLQFADGTDKRVSPERLVEYVTGDDLTTVQGALKVRQRFLKRHLPKLAMALTAGGIIGIIGLSQQQELNTLMHRADPKPLAEHYPSLTSHAQTLATPAPTPSHSTNVLAATASPSVTPTPSSSPGKVPSTTQPHKSRTTHHWKIKLLNISLPSL
ncbi:MAG: hypothetical protein ABIS59_02400 [Candidatus Saccharibacteria bacterium]